MYQKFQVSFVQIEIISNLIILSIMLLHHAEITNKTYLEIVEAAIGRAESNNSFLLDYCENRYLRSGGLFLVKSKNCADLDGWSNFEIQSFRIGSI